VEVGSRPRGGGRVCYGFDDPDLPHRGKLRITDEWMNETGIGAVVLHVTPETVIGVPLSGCGTRAGSLCV
jgi:hypothetical protein